MTAGKSSPVGADEAHGTVRFEVHGATRVTTLREADDKYSSTAAVVVVVNNEFRSASEKKKLKLIRCTL